MRIKNFESRIAKLEKEDTHSKESEISQILRDQWNSRYGHLSQEEQSRIMDEEIKELKEKTERMRAKIKEENPDYRPSPEGEALDKEIEELERKLSSCRDRPA